MLTNIHRGIMGTVEFDGQFQGMRKPQSFIVYPMHAGNPTDSCKVQSDTRIGGIRLIDGIVIMSPPRAGGAFNHHLALAVPVGRLTGEELLALKAGIMATADGAAGTSVMHTDNSGALDVFA
jgi:hypothetical protein